MMRLDTKLQNRYEKLFKKNHYPRWAYRQPPSIPFIGNNYSEQAMKCLVYASAENLTYLNQEHVYDINKLKRKQKFNRHRELSRKPDHFTKIHLEPINNGSLLIVARYVLARLGYDKNYSASPISFLEQISTGNFGKFSIKADSNQDYASSFSHLRESLDYVLSDIEILQPDILIIPSSIWRFAGIHRKLQPQLRSGVKIIKIYQTNRQVIGGHIGQALKLMPNFKPASFPFCESWLNKITDTGINRTEMEKYIKWLNYYFSDLVEVNQ